MRSSNSLIRWLGVASVIATIAGFLLAFDGQKTVGIFLVGLGLLVGFIAGAAIAARRGQGAAKD